VDCEGNSCAFQTQDIAGVDDAADFQAVCHALTDIGIGSEDQSALWTLLSGVLWLGNTTIQPDPDTDGSRVARDEALSNATKLLGLSEDALAHAVTTKKIRTKVGGCWRGGGRCGGLDYRCIRHGPAAAAHGLRHTSRRNLMVSYRPNRKRTFRATRK